MKSTTFIVEITNQKNEKYVWKVGWKNEKYLDEI